MTHPLSALRWRLAAALGAVSVAGCAGVPDLGPTPVPRAAESVAAARSLPAAPGVSWPQDRWWTGYGDPQLTGLVDEALAHSPDVAAAAARVRRAEALAQQAGAARRPTLDAQAEATIEKQSENNGIPAEFVPNGWQGRGRLALSGGFDLDLWGRNRAALAAAVSEARASALDAAQATLLLSTAVVRTYGDFEAAFAEQDVRQRALAVRQASRDLIAKRVASELENRGSLRQADVEVADAAGALIQAQAQVLSRRAQLAALVGAGPDRGLDLVRPVLAGVPVRPLPEGVTTDLVGRRPDIVAARERVEAAGGRIDVARADFFPAIRLGALIGVQSLGLANLVDPGSTFGSIGPAISLPIFRGGALGGRFRQARAEFDEAVANYDRAVVNAYRDVAIAATGARLLGEQLGQARRALAAAEDSYRVAQDRYRAGLSTYLDVLAVEDRLFAARQRVAEVEANVRASDIALVQALGGSVTGATPSMQKEDLPHG